MPGVGHDGSLSVLGKDLENIEGDFEMDVAVLDGTRTSQIYLMS